MRYQPEQQGPSSGEMLIVSIFGGVLILVGLVGVYFGFMLDRSGPLRIVGSVAVIGIGLYIIYSALVGKEWVGKIKPSPSREDQKWERR